MRWMLVFAAFVMAVSWTRREEKEEEEEEEEESLFKADAVEEEV